jgi:succinate dehydrogenase/fumarate reductase flavoprotein subunit
MNENMQRLLDSGIIFSGENAEDLAGKLGLDAKALTETIDAFNEDIKDGTDDAFGREQNLNAIEGTLYGYRFGVGAHYFMGGVLINENTEVLNTEGNVIEGLYAAGEVTGGFHGNFRVDGSGLGDSFTFGRIAGRVLAEASK